MEMGVHTTNLFALLQLRHVQANGLRRCFQRSRSWVHRFEVTSVLNGHRGCVNTIRWSSDGEILVSGSDDMMVHLWRLGPHLSGHATRPSACLPTLHRHNIFDAIMTGDKQSIVSCGADGYVCLTDIYSGQKMKLFEPDRGHFFAFKIATLPDSLGRTFFVSCSDGCVRRFDLREDDHAIAVNTGGIGLAGLSVNPARTNTIAVGGNDPFLRIYDIRTLRMHLEPGAATDMALTPAVSLHSTENMIRKQRYGMASSLFSRSEVGISGVCWSSSGQSLLANYRGGEIELFDVGPSATSETDVALAEKTTHISLPSEACSAVTLPASSVLLSSRRSFEGRPNEETCAKEVQFLCGEAAVGSGGDCGNFYVWDVSSGGLLKKLRADRHIVNCVAPHPTWPLVATSGIDSEIKVFDVADVKVSVPRSGSFSGITSQSQEAQETGSGTSPSPSDSDPSPELPEHADVAFQEAAVEEATAFRRQGNEAVGQADWISALGFYDQALQRLRFAQGGTLRSETESLELDVRLRCAFCSLNLEEFDSAVVHCNRVIQLDAYNTQAFCRRAVAHGGLLDFAAAYSDIDAAASLAPEDSDIARIRSRLKKHEKRQLKGWRR